MANAFVVTNAGLQQCVDAVRNGFSVVLQSFGVGSAYGYQPLPSDTGLRGIPLFNDNITSFYTTADDALVIQCTIALDAGPFEFGEIGIYTEAGDLFALAALQEPLIKYSGAGTNIASSYTFNCYLRLGAGTTAIVIGTLPGQGTLPISEGGTSGTTAAEARTNLGIPSITGIGATGTWPIAISGNAASATKATNVAGGALNQIPYQTAPNVTAFIPAPTLPGQALVWGGSVFGWGSASGAAELSGSGYTTLASGAILQWGVTPTLNLNQGYDVLFPIAFPHAVFALTVGGDMGPSVGNNVDLSPTFSGLTLSSVRLYPRKIFGSSGGQAKVRYIAVGY